MRVWRFDLFTWLIVSSVVFIFLFVVYVFS